MFVVNPIKLLVMFVLISYIDAINADILDLKELENKLNPLRSLAQKEAGTSVLNYFRGVLDQVEQSYNSALSSARENPAVKRLESKIKEMRQSLGLPPRSSLLFKS